MPSSSPFWLASCRMAAMVPMSPRSNALVYLYSARSFDRRRCWGVGCSGTLDLLSLLFVVGPGHTQAREGAVEARTRRAWRDGQRIRQHLTIHIVERGQAQNSLIFPRDQREHFTHPVSGLHLPF